MIKSITVINHLGESVKLELRRPEQSGFLVQKIDGLGPSKANILMTEMPTSDGALFNSARATSRNIVLLLKLMAKPTVEDTRQLTYKYFPLKKPVTLIIETDNRICKAYGYVESNEPDIFSNNVATQISILCPDPYLYSVDMVTTVYSGVEPVFEFPFSNESLIDTATNIITNGNFANGVTGWSTGSVTISATNNTLSATATGATSSSYVYKITTLPAATGKKIYMVATVKATSNVCTALKLQASATSGSILTFSTLNNPVQNQVNKMTGICTLTDQVGDLKLWVAQYFADAATANGKTMEIQEVMAVDLTATYGAGKEPSLASCDAIFTTWFDGTVKGSLLEFGDIQNLSLKSIYYTGDAETGVLITMHALGPATNITISNSNTNEIMRIDTDRLAALTGSGIVAGDDIIISTVKGNKYVTLVRDGVFINIINCLERNVDWIQLTKGDNLFAYTAETGATNLQFKVENYILYEGV